MFEIYDNKTSFIMIFLKRKLVYANETALYYFDSYKQTLVDSDIASIFEEEDVNILLERIKKESEFKMNLRMMSKVTRPIRYIVRSMKDTYGDDYVYIQSAKNSDLELQGYERIVTGKTIYDPLMRGKAAIISGELKKPYNSALCTIVNTFNENGIDENIKKDVVEKIHILYEKSMDCINTLVDIESRYNLDKNVFGVDYFLLKIEKRMNSYFKTEGIDAIINYSGIKYQEPVVSANFDRLAKSVITLISELVWIAQSNNKKAVIELSMDKDDGYVFIHIKGKKINIDKRCYDKILNGKIDIIDLDMNKTEKITVNIHTVNTFINMNDGVLSIKRNVKVGTELIIKLPLAQERYFLREKDYEDEIYEKILNKNILNMKGFFEK